MPSWQAKCFNLAVKTLIRRRRWGRDDTGVARRARRLFGAMPAYQWLRTRGLKVTPVSDEAVKGEWVATHSADDGVIMYIHGGGFVACSSATHRPITAALARLGKLRVFAIDYRLAPEHRYPAAVEDLLKGYRWLLAGGHSPERITIAGDSAGGSLVLSLLQKLRDKGGPMPASGVCFSPWTDLTGTGETVRSNDGKCAMFRPENMAEFAKAYLGSDAAAVPDAAPFSGEFSGMPSMLFQAGSTELLLDDSRRVHEKILAAGGESELEIYEDVFHGWQMLDGIVPEARTALTSAAKFIRRSMIL
ncbi:MAG: alpha/beta hydrolase [Pyrinomonadaceae bacterium]